MGMVGSLVGAAGSVIGGWQAAKQAKKNEEAISALKDANDARQQQNQDWFDAEYNADATQRADAQAMIHKTEEAIKNRTKAAAKSAAVMGGSEESMATNKQANAEALATVANNITTAADSRKDSLRSQYVTQQSALDATNRDLVEKENAARAAKAAAIGQAIGGLTEAAGALPW